MEIIVPDQIIMGLILYAGDAKQHIYKALDYIKNGTCERCEEEIQLCLYLSFLFLYLQL